MKNIIDEAKKYKFNSLEYVDLEDIVDAKVFIKTEECIFIYKDVRDKIQLFWAAMSKLEFLKGLNEVAESLSKKQDKKLYIEFIPEDFIDEIENLGFRIASEFVDFWSNDLSTVSLSQKESLLIRRLRKDEHMCAAEITRACRGFSRGFNGESDEWIKEWNETENSCVFVTEIDDKIVGLCCVSLYGFESEKGPVLWLRELAVEPKYHSKGIGYSLLDYAFHWGKENGAKRSFLACDCENYKAIRLYEKFGYKKQEGRGQINMAN